MDEKIKIAFDYNDPKLCVNCNKKDFTVINGFPRCYWRCPKRNIKGMNKWL